MIVLGGSAGRVRRILSLAVCTACALMFLAPPTAAIAALAPGNDNYQFPGHLNKPGAPLDSRSTLVESVDTTGASLQTNILVPGCKSAGCARGPSEPSTCDGVRYGKTVWYAFYPNHDGQIEIQTKGFPAVIALYAIDPSTEIPHEQKCAPGSSSYAPNVLFDSVRRGVGYAVQIGGRAGTFGGDDSGDLRVLFNYAYQQHLTVAPFKMSYSRQAVSGQPGSFSLVKLSFLGLAADEHVSFNCAFCSAAGFPAPTPDGNTDVVRPASPPMLHGPTSLLVTATAPAEYGRYKLYLLNPATTQLSLTSQGCLGVGVTVPTGMTSTTLPPQDAARCPRAVLVNAPGAEYLFWRVAGGGILEKWFNGVTWSKAFRPFKGGRLGSAPAVVVHPNGEQDVFWRGTDGHLWEAWFTGQWHGPAPLNSGELGSGPAAGIDAVGNEYVFWKGTGGGLWGMSYSHKRGAWGPAAPAPATGLASPPSVVVHGDGQQDVFWKGTDGHLWETSHTNRWSSPGQLGGAGQLGSAPAAGIDASGDEKVFWEGTDGYLWTISYSPGLPWTTAVTVESDKIGSPPAVIVHPDGEQDVFWRGIDGRLWETWWTGQWIGPTHVGTGAIGSLLAAGLDGAPGT